MRTRRTILGSFLIFAFLLVPATALAQEESVPLHSLPTGRNRGTGSISGKVTLPSGQPVSERIRIVLSTMTNPGFVLYTDNTGGFGFTGLVEGVYTIEVSGDAKLYDTVLQEVRLIRGTHVRLTINLKERARDRAMPAGHVVSLAELEQKVPDAARKEFEAGTRLVAEERIKEAAERFKKAIAIYPQYLMARNDLGVQYLKLKMRAEAVEQFEAALEVNPKVFNPRLNLGIALVEQNKYAEAIDHLNLAISINGSSAAAHLYAGIASLEIDELPAAERELAAALTLGGAEYAISHYYSAHVHLKKGEREAAIREFEAFLETKPTGELATRARLLLQRLKA